MPVKNKSLLKKWIYHIGRKSLPLNPNTRVCSKHFVNAHKRCLRPDEFPTENLPVLPTQSTRPTPRRVLIRKPIHNDDDDLQVHLMKDVAVSTEPDELHFLQSKVVQLELELSTLQKGLTRPAFSIDQIAHNDHHVLFYTGFATFKQLETCFDFLGPAKYNFEYRDSKCKAQATTSAVKRGRPRSLSLINEFFLVLVRLKLGLLEDDLAFHFKLSLYLEYLQLGLTFCIFNLKRFLSGHQKS